MRVSHAGPGRRTSGLSAVLLAASLTPAFTFAGPVAAQTLVGTVVEEGTGMPLAGAFVQLEDSVGVRTGGVLTDADGRFALRAAGPGHYRVVVDLIGYAGTRTPVELSGSGTARLMITVPVEAVSLGGIRAEVTDRCHRRPGGSGGIARLWEEARKALEVTRWAGEGRALRFQVVEHVRTLDASSFRVLSGSERGRHGFSSESPYRSVRAERLMEGGYIQRADDGDWHYFAPDADVLLSDSFLDAHCFRVVPASRGEPGLVGLGIEPVPERDLPDIEGVLWLDEGTAELRRLDFTYVNLPFEHGHWPQVGGRVEFERLATGIWIVRRWHLRMPHEAASSRSGGPAELITLTEQGAEVRTVRTAAGQDLAEASGATLFGHVTGPDGEPLAGATVEVVTHAETRTGPDGAYRLRGLTEGTWTVRVSHPALEAAGSPSAPRTVRLVAGRAVRVNFQVDGGT